MNPIVVVVAVLFVICVALAYQLGRLRGIRFVKDELAESRRNVRWMLNRP